ncbi:MAG: hypothetical protein AAF479_09295, partial [Pseudomonadota bacterium]
MKNLQNTVASTALAACMALTACTTVAYGEQTYQGWTTEQREAMYYGTQGSRLIPRIWFEALELDDGTAFANIDHLTSYGLLPPPEGSQSSYPIGVVVDQ